MGRKLLAPGLLGGRLPPLVGGDRLRRGVGDPLDREGRRPPVARLMGSWRPIYCTNVLSQSPLAESHTRPDHFLHIGPARGTMPGATVQNGRMIFSASGTQENTSAYPAAYRHANASSITNHRRAR